MTRAQARKHERVLYSVPVTVRHPIGRGLHSTRGLSVDVSEGGFAAVVESSLRVGEKVEIELGLPERALHATAVVRYVNDGRSGFEFLNITMPQRRQLRQACR